jgi:hypothetical protein
VRGDRVRREWDDIALYSRNKLGWLQSFLSLANGIPSHDTFRRVFPGGNIWPTTPEITTVALGHDEGRSSCGSLWPKEDVVSEVVEPTDQIGRGPLTCLVVQGRLSKFLERDGSGEHVKHGDQDLVGDRHGSPARLRRWYLSLYTRFT